MQPRSFDRYHEGPQCQIGRIQWLSGSFIIFPRRDGMSDWQYIPSDKLLGKCDKFHAGWTSKTVNIHILPGAQINRRWRGEPLIRLQDQSTCALPSVFWLVCASQIAHGRRKKKIRISCQKRKGLSLLQFSAYPYPSRDLSSSVS